MERRTQFLRYDRANRSRYGQPGAVYWSASPPPSMRPDAYIYALGQLQQADLKVEVVNIATGVVAASRTDTTTGTFGVSLVGPRSST